MPAASCQLLIPCVPSPSCPSVRGVSSQLFIPSKTHHLATFIRRSIMDAPEHLSGRVCSTDSRLPALPLSPSCSHTISFSSRHSYPCLTESPVVFSRSSVAGMALTTQHLFHLPGCFDLLYPAAAPEPEKERKTSNITRSLSSAPQVETEPVAPPIMALAFALIKRWPTADNLEPPIRCNANQPFLCGFLRLLGPGP